jgi:hypothetical protein
MGRTDHHPFEQAIDVLSCTSLAPQRLPRQIDRNLLTLLGAEAFLTLQHAVQLAGQHIAKTVLLIRRSMDHLALLLSRLSHASWTPPVAGRRASRSLPCLWDRFFDFRNGHQVVLLEKSCHEFLALLSGISQMERQRLFFFLL